MRAAMFRGAGQILVEDVPDPVVTSPTDAVVRVTHSCVCGSDLWAYRGQAKRSPGQPIGHEFIGVVTEVGAAVRTLRLGDEVIAPFAWSDGTCRHCVRGLQTSCPSGGYFGRSPGACGAQAQAVRVPQADGTLVGVPAGSIAERATGLLTLSDVLGTGHHAAVSAGVRPGSTVAVVGDGAVGLCGVLAARRLGAERVIVLGRHQERMALAERFGATDTMPAGPEAETAVLELTHGELADAVLECVGTEQSLSSAVAVCRDGGTVGFVGVPHLVGKPPFSAMFARNVGLRGGIAPVRAYIPQLLPDVLDGTLDPGALFDVTLALEDVAQGYELMDSRQALKVLLPV